MNTITMTPQELDKLVLTKQAEALAEFARKAKNSMDLFLSDQGAERKFYHRVAELAEREAAKLRLQAEESAQ